MKRVVKRALYLGMLFVLSGMVMIACKKKDDPPPSGGGGGGGGGGNLTSTPASLTLQITETKSTVISGGNGTYSIKTAPNLSIATGSISGINFSTTGVANGTTSAVIKDSDGKTVSITITVEDPGGGTTYWNSGTVTCDVDATPFAASLVQASLQNQSLSIAGLLGSESVLINVDSVSAAGTYSIQANKGVYTDPSSVPYNNQILGTLVVSSLSPSSLTGTFSFTAVNASMVTVTITNGVFSLAP